MFIPPCCHKGVLTKLLKAHALCLKGNDQNERAACNPVIPVAFRKNAIILSRRSTVCISSLIHMDKARSVQPLGRAGPEHALLDSHSP